MGERATRVERDTMGAVEVPADRLWGAQTQRSIEHFAIGRDRFVWGRAVVRAFGIVKGAAAATNAALGVLDRELAAVVEQAAAEVEAGVLDQHFPLVVWQTGSGTQSNMNANEVIANRAIQLLGGTIGSKHPVHPNDHVNLGQSSNDVFPAVMHLAATLELDERLIPAVTALLDVLAAHVAAFAGIVKLGRTHLQDATPITLGQEVSAWVAQIDAALAGVRHAMGGLQELALGATAVGTGIGAHPRFGDEVAAAIAARTGRPFRRAGNLFAALGAHDAMAATSASLRTLAGALFVMANNVRWLASGPRAGIGELRLPENEPGSSIMPGKVNPTQCEALLMVAMQVHGNDAAVAFAATQGNFQLNVAKPVIAHNVLESIALLADATRSFTVYAATGLEPDLQRIARHLDDSLMLVTALAPHVGYDRAAAIAKMAHERGTPLRDAALAAGVLPADYDRWVVPAELVGPTLPDPGASPGGPAVKPG
jgi:fumarate hydratase class II